jgi:hypothetical protein
MRERRSMTLEVVAESLGCTKAQLSKLERGQVRLNDEWLDKLSGLFCCSVHDLIDDETPLPEMQSMHPLEPREFAMARMLGFVHSKEAGLIQYSVVDKQYPICFAAPKKLVTTTGADVHYFALTVKGGVTYGIADNAQLIFASINESTLHLVKQSAWVVCTLKGHRGEGLGDVLRQIEVDDAGLAHAMFYRKRSRQAPSPVANHFLLGQRSDLEQKQYLESPEALSADFIQKNRNIPLNNKGIDITAVLVKIMLDQI